MSLTEILHRNNLGSDATIALRYTFERALFKWIMNVADCLKLKVKHDLVSPVEAQHIWNVKHACYLCCKRALKEGRLP